VTKVTCLSRFAFFTAGSSPSPDNGVVGNLTMDGVVFVRSTYTGESSSNDAVKTNGFDGFNDEDQMGPSNFTSRISGSSLVLVFILLKSHNLQCQSCDDERRYWPHRDQFRLVIGLMWQSTFKWQMTAPLLTKSYIKIDPSERPDAR